jgi:DNA-binding response OmpR family regulator
VKPKRVSDGAPESIIIVAEHDVLARMVLAEYLRECGYHVIEAASEADVLIVLKAKPVSIILLNAQISGEGEGFKLARRIRDAHPGTDLIMTSGVAKSASKAGELCDQGPLEKPYHPQQLVRQIHRLREKRKVPASRR